ncbi:cytochrome P450 [Trametopsis cervina]|nr:cytochrome P450 [Trametopsis cervina]
MDYTTLAATVCTGLALFLAARPFVIVPPELRHLPRVPVLPLLWSYLTVEAEDKRLRRLVLPFLNEKGEEVVLVWALGRWMVHILDHKLATEVFADIDRFPKEDPPDDLLLWRLIGRNNILLSNGDKWRMHSKVIRNAINQTIPVAQFAALSRRVFSVFGPGESIQRFDDMSQRFALDAVGTTAFGYNFDAIAHESEFVHNYNHIMHGIANPLYLIVPLLERIIPRRALKKSMDVLTDGFQEMLANKRDDPGNDMLTNMLREVKLNDREIRDNMILLFIAGHDTSAGGISSLVYLLAKHPELQERARKEVMSVLGATGEPTLENVQQMPYLMSCSREALRINTPISYVVARAADTPVKLGRYTVPARASLIVNMYAIHHDERHWPNAYEFDPDRFPKGGLGPSGVAWMPFGGGPRQCPARAFALNEQMVLSSMLLREYEWSLPEGSPHKDTVQNAFSPFALSLPHNLDIRFAKIQPK